MRGMLLNEFIRRVQDAGGNLGGCSLSKDGMDNPHIFIRLITRKSGDPLVEVRTGGSSNIANMINDLIVESISISSRSRIVHKDSQPITIFFNYP